jgi:hypothetical protein
MSSTLSWIGRMTVKMFTALTLHRGEPSRLLTHWVAVSHERLCEMDDEEQSRHSPERHFLHERRREVEAQELDMVRLFAAQVARFEEDADPLQARGDPPPGRSEVLLERSHGLGK